MLIGTDPLLGPSYLFAMTNSHLRTHLATESPLLSLAAFAVGFVLTVAGASGRRAVVEAAADTSKSFALAA